MAGDDVDVRVRLREARKAASDAALVSKGIRGIGKESKEAGRQSLVSARAFGVARQGSLGLAVASRNTALAVGGLSIVMGAKAVRAAVDLGEQINKTGAVFKDGKRDVVAFSESTAYGLGISQRAALEAAGNFGSMLVPMGLARKQAAGMSTRLVALAGDMASFGNKTPEEALNALRSGLAGESEPLRDFGVNLSAARVEQEAATLGLEKHHGELSAAAKAQATYNLILKDTKDQQGDFKRTSTSLANQQRIMAAGWENLTATIGSGAIPELTRVAIALNRVENEANKIARRPDLDLKQKLGLTSEMTQRELRPLAQAFGDGLKKAGLGKAIGDGIEDAAPEIADAFARAAPKAAGAFVHAFMDAGPGGKLLTGALLYAKLRPAMLGAGELAGSALGKSTIAGYAAYVVSKEGQKLLAGTVDVLTESIDAKNAVDSDPVVKQGRKQLADPHHRSAMRRWDRENPVLAARRRTEGLTPAVLKALVQAGDPSLIPGGPGVPDAETLAQNRSRNRRAAPSQQLGAKPAYSARADSGKRLKDVINVHAHLHVDGREIAKGNARTSVRAKDSGG